MIPCRTKCPELVSRTPDPQARAEEPHSHLTPRTGRVLATLSGAWNMAEIRTSQVLMLIKVCSKHPGKHCSFRM